MCTKDTIYVAHPLSCIILTEALNGYQGSQKQTVPPHQPFYSEVLKIPRMRKHDLNVNNVLKIVYCCLRIFKTE